MDRSAIRVSLNPDSGFGIRVEGQELADEFDDYLIETCGLDPPTSFSEGEVTFWMRDVSRKRLEELLEAFWAAR